MANRNGKKNCVEKEEKKTFETRSLAAFFIYIFYCCKLAGAILARELNLQKKKKQAARKK